MGAPRGNKNGVKAKRWEQALKRALARSGGSVDRGLDPIADQVVEAAKNGYIDAIQEIASRLDGKPTEHVHIETVKRLSYAQRVKDPAPAPAPSPAETVEHTVQ